MELFNFEGDFILSIVEEIYLTIEIASLVVVLFSSISKSSFYLALKEKFIKGSSLSKRNYVKTKNLLPKSIENPNFAATGEIIVIKDVEFDIHCLEINFNGYSSTL